jgi:hypothetical protein
MNRARTSAIVLLLLASAAAADEGDAARDPDGTLSAAHDDAAMRADRQTTWRPLTAILAWARRPADYFRASRRPTSIG